MTASIRGHKGSIKVFVSGKDAEIINITSFEANQDSTFSRSHYVGQQLPVGDQTIEGWSGSLDTEVTGAQIDDLIDLITAENLRGVGVEDKTLVLTENYPDGQVRSYVSFDCQFKMSKRNPPQTEKVTKRLEFQASARLPL